MELCLLIHEFQLAPSRSEWDYTESEVLKVGVPKAPVLVMYGRNRAGTRVTAYIHGVRPM